VCSSLMIADVHYRPVVSKVGVGYDLNLPTQQDIVWQAFKIFDSDGSGTVTKAELSKLLTSGRSDKTRHEKEAKTIEAFLDSYDTSGDGVVDFNEFLDMLDGSQDKAKQKAVAKTDSAPKPAENSYLGFCSSITSATCEKEQVPGHVISSQSSKRLSKRVSHGKNVLDALPPTLHATFSFFWRAECMKYKTCDQHL